MNTSQQDTQNKQPYYYDNITRGLGYLNSIRTVEAKKDPYLACKITGICGSSDDPGYIYYDLNVKAKDAAHLVKRCVDACTQKRKVLVGFTIGDAMPQIFTFQKGNRQGEQGVSMKGRLLSISWIKIDGVMVYKAEKKSPSDTQSQSPVNTNQATAATATATAIATQAVPQTAQAPAIAESKVEVPVEIPAEAVADSFSTVAVDEAQLVSDNVDVPAEVMGDSFGVDIPVSQPTPAATNALNSTESF